MELNELVAGFGAKTGLGELSPRHLVRPRIRICNQMH